jgi:hypothetical protein
VIKLALKYQILLCGVLFFVKLSAQDKVKSFGLKGTYHYGFIMAHRDVVSEIIEGHTKAIEVSLFKRIASEKQWDEIYNQPKLGVSLLYLDLANPLQLGKSFGIYPYLSFIKGSGIIRWENKFGVGLGYIEKPYDRKTNYQNLAIGSTINGLISVNTQVNIKLSDQLNTTVGLSVIHFSNGAITMPNLGINILSLNMGMAYQFGDDVSVVKSESKEKEHTWSKNMAITLGLKEIQPVEGPKYMITTTSFNVMKRRSNINSFGAGIDFFYNSSLTALLAQEESYVKSNTDNVRLGVTLIYALDFGKFSAFAQWGGYLYNKETKKGMLYNRYHIRYHATEKIFINLGLKTHRAEAEFLEVGVGYRFK